MNTSSAENLATSGAWNWLLLGEWLIALGILAVAGGVLWTVVQNRRSIRAESTPNLILSDIVFSRLEAQNAYRLSYLAVNLGRYPVYLRALSYNTDAMNGPASDALHLLLPPSEARTDTHDFSHLTLIESGTLRFEFQYGATGTWVHKLEFPLGLNAQNVPVVETARSSETAAKVS